MVSRETKRGRVSLLRRGAGAEDIGEREGGGARGGDARSVGSGWRSAQAARSASQPGAVRT
jgi:hypothetical protein